MSKTKPVTPIDHPQKILDMMDRVPRFAVFAILILALPTEWVLAVHVYKIPWYLAWTVPVIVEAYVLVALELHRHRWPAGFLFVGSLMLSTGVHMIEELGYALHTVARIGGLATFLVFGFLAVVAMMALRRQVKAEKKAWDDLRAAERAAEAAMRAEQPTKVTIEAPRWPQAAEQESVRPVAPTGGVEPAQERTAPESSGWPPKGAYPTGKHGVAAAKRWAEGFQERNGRWPNNGEFVKETGYKHDQQARRLVQWCAEQDAESGAAVGG